MARISSDVVNVANTFSNTTVNIIKITEDKLINILTHHVSKLRKSKEWIAALSFSASLLLVLLTSNFSPKWGLTGEQWQMLFLLLFVMSLAYLGYTIYNCIKHSVSVQSIVDDIKRTE